LDLTARLTEKDYVEVVKGISTEILRRGLPSGAVVMLGPVDTKGTFFHVDIDKLQTEISAELGPSGDVKFALRQGVLANEPAVAEMYKLIDLNWSNDSENLVSPEALKKFGKMAKINEIIFGRVSTQTDPREGGGFVVTHTFAWSLGNVERGTLDMTPIIKKVHKEVGP
jgi:acetylglutamate kinase